jgi:hypothetical protein
MYGLGTNLSHHPGSAIHQCKPRTTATTFSGSHLSGFRTELIITSIQTPFYCAGFYVKALHFCFELKKKIQ